MSITTKSHKDRHSKRTSGQEIPPSRLKNDRVFLPDHGRPALRGEALQVLLGHTQRRGTVWLSFSDQTFDAVVCLQNGISAFHVDPERLIGESLRVTKPGGTVFFSSYSDRFWAYRLAWFELQAAEGLVGEIDYGKTGAGKIVGKDGFTTTTVGPEEFRRLTASLRAETAIYEIDDSEKNRTMLRSTFRARGS